MYELLKAEQWDKYNVHNVIRRYKPRSCVIHEYMNIKPFMTRAKPTTMVVRRENTDLRDKQGKPVGCINGKST